MKFTLWKLPRLPKLVAINVAHGQGVVKPCRMTNRSWLKLAVNEGNYTA
ncbi:MAG: hypothetical protein QGG39_03550 [Candidatus Poribacteria bacterium]|nr:hypothetical protein [Candidatus Poribacteria bacterium]